MGRLCSWTLQEPQVERPEHQDDPDVHHEPLPEPVPEEQDVYDNHDGHLGEHVERDGCLSSHPPFLQPAAQRRHHHSGSYRSSIWPGHYAWAEGLGCFQARRSACEVVRRSDRLRPFCQVGEIEHLPVADATADVILSNCVINLVADKKAAFQEAWRALKPGGRLAISDVVAIAPLPAALQEKVAALTGCISGASPVEELRAALSEVGFTEVRIDVKPGSREFIRDWMPGSGSEDYIASAAIAAVKPKEQSCCGPTCCAS